MPSSGAPVAPQQRVIKVRRDYNDWVARESLEDYALRFTPHSFRKWSEWRVAHTALGGAASFLVLEALGATLLLQFGFVNAFWAILATAAIIFAAGLPISVVAARHGLDMDLLTRGAGFGYIGSTITSLIYASFTFIFFALEAAIMAYALELAFDIPPAWGYALSALVVIPLVTHGVTAISQLQMWTQPLWLVLLITPYVYVFQAHPGLVDELRAYAGIDGRGGAFDPLLFGGALTVGVALITQMGEQVDYLRFMPARTAANRGRWWLAVLVGGPGWVLPGVLKMLGGALLATLALSLSVPADRAVDPNQMYLAAYEGVFPRYGWAVAATALLVIVSQLKINVTNAYAGSLAWSNFFARATHSHPGRVVWVVFNTLIALMLMELEVFRAIGGVLGLYSNIAISWIMAVVADLVINKPLGLSPAGIEFRRAHLYDINPVGVGAMGAASLLSVLAYLGVFGGGAQAFSAAIAMGVALLASPLLAWATRGRYYIARPGAAAEGAYLGQAMASRCVICERAYEGADMAPCPAYGGPICSLCCSLDARCQDLCKPPEARASLQIRALLRRLLPRAWWPQLDTGLGHYLPLMAVVAPALAGLLYLLYELELRAMGEAAALLGPALRAGFVKAYCALLLVSGVIAWWLVLTRISRRVAQEESNRQTEALVKEIDSHARTDEQLQRARHAADAANRAKTRYISAISHELRTPLNSILGYAQLLDEDPAMPTHRRQAVGVIRRGGEHLLSLIEGTLDIARIEGGKLTLDARPVRLREALQQIVQMFELQALGKGLRFEHDVQGAPELVRADERRLTQILINVLGNAVKFTPAGRVAFRASHLRDMAVFEIEDSGPGIAEADLARIFEPFSRGAHAEAASHAAGGTGLGLTIAKMLTELMGGELTVSSRLGQGTLFRIRLFLPELQPGRGPVLPPPRKGYSGARRRLLVVDNEEVDRLLLARRLEALGFDVLQAASGQAAVDLMQEEGQSPHGAGRPVDAILMDLAMPGIDGWETLRTLRRLKLSAAPAAIVSANAFDKALDNDVGITAADFITKPVRFDELLDWLGAQLGLQWLAAAPAPPPPALSGNLPLPSREQLLALQEVISLGYPRGVQRLLDEIAAARPDCAAWLAPLRALAQAFRFDPMTRLIQDALAKTHTA
ncbi:ATP-binding protein [Rubrivivax sp. A210]|uniref:hybrid sensor histidine kinase/response regulator n=1 Tax=Rubrivivax sp. A210 TaxID=2772301 RepID=UPI001F2A799E|nr:ATP-binding protein [Rubrivivax sp. A210]